jgi:two-component system, response regulator
MPMTTQAAEIEILLVEDSVEDAELTLRALRRQRLDRRVQVVGDGAQALELLFGAGDGSVELARPRLILLDLKLPKVDGIEVLRRIKNDERTRTIPVVMLTSSREERDLVQSYRLGVNSYIVKPVDAENFILAISEIGLYWLLRNESPHPNA